MCLATEMSKQAKKCSFYYSTFGSRWIRHWRIALDTLTVRHNFPPPRSRLSFYFFSLKIIVLHGDHDISFVPDIIFNRKLEKHNTKKKKNETFIDA